MYYFSENQRTELHYIGFYETDNCYALSYWESMLKDSTINQVAISSVIQAVVKVGFKNPDMRTRRVPGLIEIVTAIPLESVKSIFACDDCLQSKTIKDNVIMGEVIVPGGVATLISISDSLESIPYNNREKE